MPDGYNTGYYNSQASDLQYRYNTDKAANSYGRFLSQQRGSRAVGDLSRDFNRSLPSYKSQFGQRGLAGPGVRSGVMRRSMGNYLGDYTTAYQRAQQDATQEAQQYDAANASLDAYYNNSLASLEQQKQDEIANAARAIEMLRPYLGGI
jgi:hypothetical protein